MTFVGVGDGYDEGDSVGAALGALVGLPFKYVGI